MTRLELADAVYERHGGLSRQEARELVSLVLQIVSERLSAGERVDILGFGTFEVRRTPPKSGRHPVTGRQFRTSEQRSLVFSPSRLFSDELNAEAS